MVPGTRLGRYEIKSKLGAGGMAEVYLAEDLQLGRRVALKILPPDTTADEHARKRLLREARAAATLDHPHICSVYDVGEDAGTRFIAMQYVDGQTLDGVLRRGTMPLKDALSVATDIADALADAHAHGVIHRDIKPSNVMITPRGRAVVLDFGLAKVIQDQAAAAGSAATQSALSGPGDLMGTVPYMSPEQVRGDALDARTDLFSAGIVLYEMLSGQRPFGDRNTAATASAILTREPTPLAQLAPEVPAELGRIVAKLLRKDLDARYQTAKDLAIDLGALRDEHEFQRRSGSMATNVQAQPLSTSSRTTIIAVLVVGALAAGGWFVWRQSRVRWAASQVAQVEALAAKQDFFGAFKLASQIEPYVPDNPTLTRLRPTIALPVTVTTDPPGARVFLTPFAPDASGAFPPRQLIGTTPLRDYAVARGEYVMTIEEDGYAPMERTISGVLMRTGGLFLAPPPANVNQRLIPVAEQPARMVFVAGGAYRLVGWSRPTDRRVDLDDFFVDKYEVTNQEFKEFINAGGYLKQDYWKYPFNKDGQTLSFDAAMKLLVDRSGLPGPRSWSGQNIPEGKADHPVTGVTWYEAAAYAEFRGKALPTTFQWEKAARNGAQAGPVNFMPWGVFYPGDSLAYHANFENKGTVAVTSYEFGMSPWGAYNMAGNVSEWTLNDTSQGRIAAGGAWGDPTYVFGQYAMRPPFFSSDKLGVRCVKNSPAQKTNQDATRIEILEEIPKYTASSAADFAKWSATYDYDKSRPLDARIEDVKETPDWRRERITFVGADKNDRAILYLYLPQHYARPLQVIHFVPAGDVAGGLRALPESMEDRLSSFVKSGRAAFGVVVKGYIERLYPPGRVPPDAGTIEFAEAINGRITDLRRGLDYLQTRSDIDLSKLGFFGPSSGAAVGLILAAIEPRYRSVALIGSGLPKIVDTIIPQANPANFASHIRAPKLMLNGLYDEDTPFKTAAEPLYTLLPQPKKLITYEGGHIPPNELWLSSINAWFNETMGEVKK